jgi:hypothetical protein
MKTKMVLFLSLLLLTFNVVYADHIVEDISGQEVVDQFCDSMLGLLVDELVGLTYEPVDVITKHLIKTGMSSDKAVIIAVFMSTHQKEFEQYRTSYKANKMLYK